MPSQRSPEDMVSDAEFERDLHYTRSYDELWDAANLAERIRKTMKPGRGKLKFSHSTLHTIQPKVESLRQLIDSVAESLCVADALAETVHQPSAPKRLRRKAPKKS